jgi:hypothetical protein
VFEQDKVHQQKPIQLTDDDIGDLPVTPVTRPVGILLAPSVNESTFMKY